MSSPDPTTSLHHLHHLHHRTIHQLLLHRHPFTSHTLLLLLLMLFCLSSVAVVSGETAVLKTEAVGMTSAHLSPISTTTSDSTDARKKGSVRTVVEEGPGAEKENAGTNTTSGGAKSVNTNTTDASKGARGYSKRINGIHVVKTADGAKPNVGSAHMGMLEDTGTPADVIVNPADTLVIPGEPQDGSPVITWGEGGAAPVYFHHDSPTNVTAIVGHPAALPCVLTPTTSHQLEEKVSWIRQRDLHILTVGIFTYTTDTRFKALHSPDTARWVLEIRPVTFSDAGVYECQVSSSPKIALPVTLAVQAERARIEGPKEVYIQAGSTIRLSCRVDTHPVNVGPVAWYRDDHRLNYDSPRGGVSIEIERMPTKTTSKLFLTPALKSDSGNYTCSPQHAEPASVLVLVVSGEESAAVHTAGSAVVRGHVSLLYYCLISTTILLPYS